MAVKVKHFMYVYGRPGISFLLRTGPALTKRNCIAMDDGLGWVSNLWLRTDQNVFVELNIKNGHKLALNGSSESYILSYIQYNTIQEMKRKKKNCEKQKQNKIRPKGKIYKEKTSIYCVLCAGLHLLMDLGLWSLSEGVICSISYMPNSFLNP